MEETEKFHYSMALQAENFYFLNLHPSTMNKLYHPLFLGSVNNDKQIHNCVLQNCIKRYWYPEKLLLVQQTSIMKHCQPFTCV